MTDIEAKALALWNKVRAERGWDAYVNFSRYPDSQSEALCRAIEQHEAFKQKVSDAVVDYFGPKGLDVILAGYLLERFIIPKPKPDPLLDIVERLGGEWKPEEYVKEIRAALEARGFEIREKNDD